MLRHPSGSLDRLVAPAPDLGYEGSGSEISAAGTATALGAGTWTSGLRIVLAPMPVRLLNLLPVRARPRMPRAGARRASRAGTGRTSRAGASRASRAPRGESCSACSEAIARDD